jgi:hypothetical protein
VKLGGASDLVEGVSVVLLPPPPKTSKSEPPVPVDSEEPKLELAPVPLVFAGVLDVELKAELGAELPELDDPEEPEDPALPEVLSD